ncbi:MAG: class I SAM-dependent rRNA methyltransferase [Candidatus Omnitrophota bacterium]
MNKNSFLTITIKPRMGKRAKSGHPWIFSNEIGHPSPKPESGELVSVLDEGGSFLGYASYNPHSLIALRLLSRDVNAVPGSVEWFAQKFRAAAALRQRFYPSRRSYRLAYADSDGLPGLAIDRYEDVLALQIQTAGMERWLDLIAEALKRVINPAAIVLRNDSDIRKLEGLSLYSKVLYGNAPETVEIEENGVKLAVDILSGQKTGHFFDQADNRAALAPFVKEAEVLDLFCHTGAWALKMLSAGARHAAVLDSSESALALARRNAELNGFAQRMEFIQSDAFTWLSSARRERRVFDAVVVDPPAFAKSAKQIKNALRGYEDVNRQAIRAVKDGGLLCSCSCSYYITEDEFLALLQRAAARERKRIAVLQVRGQAMDHPILLAMPESRYLKCVIGVVESL